MLKTLLSNYKWYLIAAIFVLWSGAVWHISGTYATATLVKEELVRNQNNAQLSKEIMETLANTTDKWNAQAKLNTKALLDEILKDPRYKSCRTTDGVRESLQRKLDSQPD